MKMLGCDGNMKRWLVIKNDQYYPSAATDDWLATFADDKLSEAEKMVEDIKDEYSSTYIIDMWEWMADE